MKPRTNDGYEFTNISHAAIFRYHVVFSDHVWNMKHVPFFLVMFDMIYYHFRLKYLYSQICCKHLPWHLFHVTFFDTRTTSDTSLSGRPIKVEKMMCIPDRA